jgi:hypothetical protein
VRWTQKHRAAFVRQMRLAKKTKKERSLELAKWRVRMVAMPTKQVDEYKARGSIYFVPVEQYPARLEIHDREIGHNLTHRLLV